MEHPTTELLYCGNDNCHDDEGDGDGDRRCHDRNTYSFLCGDYDDDDDGDDHDDDIEKYKSLRSETLIVIGVL